MRQFSANFGPSRRGDRPGSRVRFGPVHSDVLERTARFEQRLETGEDVGPAVADALRRGTARREVVMRHGQLDDAVEVLRLLDQEGDPRGSLVALAVARIGERVRQALWWIGGEDRTFDVELGSVVVGVPDRRSLREVGLHLASPPVLPAELRRGQGLPELLAGGPDIRDVDETGLTHGDPPPMRSSGWPARPVGIVRTC